MSQSLYGPTARSPEPSPPEFDDPLMIDPQDLDDAGRRAWVCEVGDDIVRDLCVQLMAENGALVGELARCRSDVTDLSKALKDLLAQVNNIEVLGEWSAMDINLSSQKRARAIVDAVVAYSRAALAKAAP